MTAIRPPRSPGNPPFPLHPFFLAVAPLWAMYAANVDNVRFESFLRPAIAMLVFTAVGLLVLRPIMPDLVRRGILVYVLIWSMHSYDTLYYALNFVPGAWRHVLAAGVIAATLALAAWGLRRVRLGLYAVTVFLNVMLGVFLISDGVRLVDRSWVYLSTGWREAARDITQALHDEPLRPPAQAPDIYYIILDGYARADVLQEIYRYDNSPFIQHLTEKGFYVPSEARSNYPFTYASIASSLNGTYLEALGPTMRDGTIDYRVLASLIDDNGAARQLRAAGYSYVFVSSDFEATWSSSTADVCVCDQYGFGQLTTRWARRTPLMLWPEAWRWAFDPFAAHRRKVTDQLAALAAPAETDRPRFVFAHLLVPHLPFVFGADGEPIQQTLDFSFVDGDHPSRAGYIEGYRDQLTYVNGQIERVVDGILARSEVPPIIILQADHGPNSSRAPIPPEDVKERYAIFVAYYLPGKGARELYATITPVNTFRVIFNTYFGTHMELLPDSSYYTVGGQVYP